MGVLLQNLRQYKSLHTIDTVLVSFRSKVFETEMQEILEELKDAKITILAENHSSMIFIKHYIEVYKVSINAQYIKIKELLEGEVNRKFDYIVGNPPYQYPKGVVSSKKLYIDITKKCQNLLKEDGELNFITPQAILKDSIVNKIVYQKLKTNLVEVNYNANNEFNIGQNIISFRYKNKKESNKIQIIENLEERTVYNINDICKKSNILLTSILNKLVSKTKTKRLKICRSSCRFGIHNKRLGLTKTNEYNNEVICNTKKQRIKFSKCLETKYPQLVIPYVGGWSEGCFITTKNTNHFWYVNKQEESLEILKNMKSYIESKLVTYCVLNYKEKIKPSAFYGFTGGILEIDFARSWTDEEVYNEFKLTKEEIEEVEKWCKTNPTLLPRHDNPWNEI